MSFDCTKKLFEIGPSDGGTDRTKAVAVATGARQRKLDVLNFGHFEGQGIHNAAAAMEGILCAATSRDSYAAAVKTSSVTRDKS